MNQVVHNEVFHACAMKRAQIRSRNDAFRVCTGTERDHSTSANDVNICTRQSAVVTQYTATAI